MAKATVTQLLFLKQAEMFGHALARANWHRTAAVCVRNGWLEWRGDQYRDGRRETSVYALTPAGRAALEGATKDA